jgi:hypothetical protein
LERIAIRQGAGNVIHVCSEPCWVFHGNQPAGGVLGWQGKPSKALGASNAHGAVGWLQIAGPGMKQVVADL